MELSSRLGYIDIEGKKVYKIDLSNLSGESLILCCRKVVVSLGLFHGRIPFFIDVTNCKLNIESMSFLKSAGKNIQEKVDFSVIVGLNPNLMPFFYIYKKYTGSSIEMFNSKSEAFSRLSERLNVEA